MTEKLLERVRALLAKAEATDSVHEAEALTARASDLMARYGIDRAMVGALHPESDKPGDKQFTVPNPWGDSKARLLAEIAKAMRCQIIWLNSDSGKKLHVFGYESDLERAEMLWTSLLVQMFRALASEQVPPYVKGNSAKAWRRAWMYGFASTVAERVAVAEHKAADESDVTAGGKSTTLVLADRSVVIASNYKTAYPSVKTTRSTFSGGGLGRGQEAGRRADIGGGKVGSGSGRAISR